MRARNSFFLFFKHLIFWAQEVETWFKYKKQKSKTCEEQGGRLIYEGCGRIKDVGNGQRQNNISWTRIHEIQRRLVQGRLGLAGSW